MEIEGLINHTLASFVIEKDFIAKKVQENADCLRFWRNIKKIHINVPLRQKLHSITHIRELLGSEEYMEDMIRQESDKPLYFHGHPLKEIEFYLHLRDSIKGETTLSNGE